MAAISHAHAAAGIAKTDDLSRHPVVVETIKGAGGIKDQRPSRPTY